MLRPGGYGITTYAEGGRASETDTFTCCHCNRIVEVTPFTSPTDLGGWCALCAKPVCKECAGKECFPFEKKLVLIEKRAAFLRNLGL